MIHMTGDGVAGKGVNRQRLYREVLEVDGNFEANKGEGKLGESQTDDVNHDGHKIMVQDHFIIYRIIRMPSLSLKTYVQTPI